MQPNVAVIMINYKEYADRFLVESVASLNRQTYKNFTLYIADNVTTLETQMRLREIAPHAVVVGTFGNGWGHGNNVAAARAMQDGCEYLAFVNMDTYFHERWLEELVAAIVRDTKFGIVQSKVLLYPPVTPPPNDDPTQRKINSVGNVLHYLGFGYCIGYNDLASNYTKTEPQPVGITSGVAMIMRATTFVEVGKCNEEYFMYHDDIELAMKVKFLGLKLMLAPKSMVYHKYEFSRSVRLLYYMERNRFMVLFTFFNIPTLVLIAPMLLCMEVGMWYYAIKTDWVKTKWDVTKWLFMPSTWNMIKRDRAKLALLRRVDDKDLLKDMTGEINFQEINNPLLQHVANPLFKTYFKFLRVVVRW